MEKVFETVIAYASKGGYQTKRIELPRYTTSIYSLLANIWFLRNCKADIYHITGDIHYAVFAFPRKKVVLTIHDSVFLFQHKGLKRWFMKKIFLDWPARYASKITTISERSKRDIIEFGGIAEEKIVIIPDPLNAFITSSPLLFKSEKPRILFIGATPNKNLERTLEALKGIACELHLIGKFSSDQINRLEGSGLDYTIFSNLTEEELNLRYASADLLLFPTLFEGFGLPIIEAQQAGRPVITSNIAPMCDVAGSGACLVDPYEVLSIREGILKIISDSDYRNRLIESGFVNIKRYTPEYITTSYLEVYKTLINK